jgi:peptidoglycan hydrolase-like protein with peptidoglycan-binding domain
MKSWPWRGPVGYLQVVEIGFPHFRRRAGALVVTAAAALVLGSGSPALAQSERTGPGTAAPLETKPLPSAGWHGKPIRQPYEARYSSNATTRSTGPAAMRLRAGYGRADGSAQVRRLQRMLRGLGYECGPADGWFGPRTQASVQWFQIKHGLPPTGVADAETLRILRFRDGLAPSDAPAPAAGAPVAPTPPVWQRAAAAPPQPAGRHDGASALGPILLALAVALAIAGLALLSRVAWRRRSARAPAPPPVPPDRRLAAASPGDRTAIGYARGRDAAELARERAAIERACSERGWTLASLVRDNHPTKVGVRATSGLAYALDQLAKGDASGLVTGRIEHLGRSPRRLGALLEWCAGHGVDLVAVDVGLDTSTPGGRLVAGRLVAAARNGDAHAGKRPSLRKRVRR